jgi:hypothetical protein
MAHRCYNTHDHFMESFLSTICGRWGLNSACQTRAAPWAPILFYKAQSLYWAEAVSARWAVCQSPGSLLSPPPSVRTVGAGTMPGLDVMLGIWALLLLTASAFTHWANSLDPTVLIYFETVGVFHHRPKWILITLVILRLSDVLLSIYCLYRIQKKIHILNTVNPEGLK